MVIQPPIKRILRSLSSELVFVGDLNIRLNPGEEVNVLKIDAHSNKYFRTLSQLGNSQDLDRMISAGLIQVEDEDGNILSTAQAINATYESTLYDSSSGSTGDLEPNRVLNSDNDGNISASSISSTELGYLYGVSSNIQTQIDGKPDSFLELTDTDNYSFSGYAGYGVRVNVTQDGLEFFDLVGSFSTKNHGHDGGDVTGFTADRALQSSSSGNIEASSITSTELGYLDNASSNIQTQINSKQNEITGAATTVVSEDLSANRVLNSDSNGKITASSVTSTQLSYLYGVSSNIQVQIDSKEPTLTKGNLTESTSSVLTITDGTNSVIGSGTTIEVDQADTSNDGYLSSTDWNTFNGKQDEITGAATTVVSDNLSANKVLNSDSNGKISASSISSIELSYLYGVSSNIQTQINEKPDTFLDLADTDNYSFSGYAGYGVRVNSTEDGLEFFDYFQLFTEGEGIDLNDAGNTILVSAEKASDTNKGVASFNSTNFSVVDGAVNTIQNIDVTASPTFVHGTFSQATGISPFTISSTTVVSNLNADQVDGRNETEFALLAGRSGGQILIGGTGSGDDITFQTTSNVSKGSYIFSELTDNGFIKTSGGTGTLSVDTTSYQTLDATLTALAAYNTNGLLTQTAADTFTGRTITGTADKITVTNGDGVSGNPTITVAATYVGQTSITTLGTIATGTWEATDVGVAHGGTGLSSWTSNGILYASGTTTLTNSANFTVSGATLNVGASGGTDGEIRVISSDNRIAVLESDDDGNYIHCGSESNHSFILVTNNTARLTITNAGVVSISNLTTDGPVITASGVLSSEATLAMSRGGTNANLSASTGGVVYSGASALAILAGTATAGQILRSGASAAPTWSTATYPTTAGTAGKVLVSDGTNIVSSTPTFPNASATSGKVIISDGTNWIASTTIVPNAVAQYKMLYASAANTLSATTNLSWNESTYTLESRGPVGTGATGAGILLLSTSELTIVDGDYLGRINFQAPLESDGSDAILVGASIWAEANATFSATVNNTDLVFATGSSEAATAKMRILGSGFVGINAASPLARLHVYESTALGSDAGSYSLIKINQGAVIGNSIVVADWLYKHTTGVTEWTKTRWTNGLHVGSAFNTTDGPHAGAIHSAPSCWFERDINYHYFLWGSNASTDQTFMTLNASGLVIGATAYASTTYASTHMLVVKGKVSIDSYIDKGSLHTFNFFFAGDLPTVATQNLVGAPLVIPFACTVENIRMYMDSGSGTGTLTMDVEDQDEISIIDTAPLSIVNSSGGSDVDNGHATNGVLAEGDRLYVDLDENTLTASDVGIVVTVRITAAPALMTTT